jgi:hypothetical protein
MLVQQAAVHLAAAFCLSLKMLKVGGEKMVKKGKSALTALASEKYDKWSQEWWLILDLLRLMGKGWLTA